MVENLEDKMAHGLKDLKMKVFTMNLQIILRLKKEKDTYKGNMSCKGRGGGLPREL